MRKGTVYQRHLRSCPRGEDGEYRQHKCRGAWAYMLDAGRTPEGKRKQVSKGGFPTRRAAEAALREAQARDVSSLADVHRLPVGEFLDQWLAGKRGLRPSTVQGYRSHIDRYLRPAIGHVLLTDLRPHHLDALISGLMTPSDVARSAATVRRIHATLRSALNAAVRRRLIPWNPALHVELPSADRRRSMVWTATQVGQFLDYMSEHRLHAMFRLVALAGLRRGEAVGLRWVDVDLESGTLAVAQQAVELRGRLHFGPPKTRSGDRVVPLDAGTVGALRRHRDQQSDERLKWGSAYVESGLVFTRENGEPLNPSWVTHVFQRLAAEAGLPPIRFHDLRHTSASLALVAGVPIKVVSHRLGHSTTAITADLYTHVVPEVARGAADQIAALLPSRNEPRDDGMFTPR